MERNKKCCCKSLRLIFIMACSPIDLLRQRPTGAAKTHTAMILRNVPKFVCNCKPSSSPSLFSFAVRMVKRAENVISDVEYVFNRVVTCFIGWHFSRGTRTNDFNFLSRVISVRTKIRSGQNRSSFLPRAILELAQSLKDWRRTQSHSNPSPPLNSLLTGKRAGNFAKSRRWAHSRLQLMTCLQRF